MKYILKLIFGLNQQTESDDKELGDLIRTSINSGEKVIVIKLPEMDEVHANRCMYEIQSAINKYEQREKLRSKPFRD